MDVTRPDMVALLVRDLPTYAAAELVSLDEYAGLLARHGTTQMAADVHEALTRIHAGDTPTLAPDGPCRCIRPGYQELHDGHCCVFQGNGVFVPPDFCHTAEWAAGLEFSETARAAAAADSEPTQDALFALPEAAA